MKFVLGMRIPFIFVHSSHVLIYGFLAHTYTTHLNFHEEVLVRRLTTASDDVEGYFQTSENEHSCISDIED